ncbi:MAG: glutamate racemase [Clostridia bacterium]|nr:glutamate racemase [Clostridia bacterium]
MRLHESELPIGVFDSGVGGISVLAQIARIMPREDLWYYGDLAHAPYGTKPVEEIRSYCGEIVEEMVHVPVKAIVIACNTASSVAAAELRAAYTLPIIAMEPALKPASKLRHGGKVLVLATPNTLALPKFQHLYELYGEGAERVPCPGLMELVEKRDEVGAKAYLARVISNYPGQIDAIVLGCTHYVFLRRILRDMLDPSVAVVDGNLGTAMQLQRVLSSRTLLRVGEHVGSICFHASVDEKASSDTKKKQEEAALVHMKTMYNWASELMRLSSETC